MLKVQNILVASSRNFKIIIELTIKRVDLPQFPVALVDLFICFSFSS